MKKREVLIMYNLLGGRIKFVSLQDANVRADIMKLFRALRTAVTSIEDELKILEAPAMQGATESAQNEILAEEAEGVALPLIPEDSIVTAFAESGVDLPISVVLNTFKTVLI